jgi:antitoxin component YwqK of YwqJK toxin-antitoxin module
MHKSLPTLRLNRVDFFRLRGFDFMGAVFQSIEQSLGDEQDRVKKWGKLNTYQQGFHTWWCFIGDVENGGLTQYFYNHTDSRLPPLIKLLKVTGNSSLVPIIKQATQVFRKHRQKFDVDQPFGSDGLFADMTELSKLDRACYRQFGRISKSLERWLRANISTIALGDDGQLIEPSYSGGIETHHPNGNVFEQATVRRGALTGLYRRYLDDGTLEHTCFYKSGKVSADYWPNGQPKHKTIKRGQIKLDEWYYESGNLQKRVVADKSGFAIEPIQVWHENGQLAEVIHVKNGDRYGPWQKFFPDGSPRLQAEHRWDDQKDDSPRVILVVKNAWDEKRRQIVKNGRGTYHDDGLDYDPTYRLVSQSDWTSSQELKNGVPHGKGKTWNEGVLWSTEEWVNGKRHGITELYYDNGRLRSRYLYRQGKEVSSEQFTKFDNPQPAVLLRVEANAELYKAWRHPLLDEYPSPRNLDKIQARLPMPAFLLEVFERNKTGELEERYEDLNYFDDGVGYMVMVNELGRVDEVKFSGASAYSGSVTDIYPPYIQKLTFKPGRINGRKVRCRVLVRVDHTFVEAEKQ